MQPNLRIGRTCGDGRIRVIARESGSLAATAAAHTHCPANCTSTVNRASAQRAGLKLCAQEPDCR
jgi:hypothetical protein